MRVTCHSCGATFELPDDRARGRKLRIRCRHCSSIFEATWSGRAGRTVRPGPPPPPTPRPDDEWFLALGQQALGPLSYEELCQRLRRRELSGDHFVWSPSLQQWAPIAWVPALRPALDGPPPPLRSGPPLPPPTALHALPTATSPVPAAMAQPPPVAHSLPALPAQPAQRPLPHWPTVLAAAGGAALLTAALVVLLTGRHSPEPEAGPPVPRAPRTAVARPLVAPPYTILGRREPMPGPPLEIQLRRDAAAAPDGAAAQAQRRAAEEQRTRFAARLLRRNRSSLRACATLAERRGERLRGSRAKFAVEVDPEGTAVISVSGKGLSPALLACYRSVARQWKIPPVDGPISTSFWHVH